VGADENGQVDVWH